MISPSQEVLKERIAMLYNWIICCYIGLIQHGKGTSQYKRWLDYYQLAISQTSSLEDLIRSESKQSILFGHETVDLDPTPNKKRG